MKVLPFRPRAALAPSLFLALSLGLYQCAGFFQGAGKAMVSDSDEARLGAQFHQTLLNNDTAKREFPVFKPKNQAEAEFQEYVVGLCRRAVASIPENERPKYDFTFTLIDKDEENAFAVPGGYVYIYTGIISKMEDESELAGVLGHEIAHVTWHHYRDALAKTAGLGLLLDVLLGDDAGQLAQVVAGSLFQIAALKVTRSNESEADFHGTLYSGGAERNPRGIAKYFARVKDMGFSWISSHPGPGDRVQTVNAQVDANPSLKAIADSTHDFKARFLEKTAVIR